MNTVSRRGYLIDKHGKMFNLRSNQKNADNTWLLFPGGTSGKEPACQCRRPQRLFQSQAQEDLEEGMETHSSILAWRIPWTEEPGRVQIHRVTKSQTQLKGLSTHTCTVITLAIISLLKSYIDMHVENL